MIVVTGRVVRAAKDLVNVADGTGEGGAVGQTGAPAPAPVRSRRNRAGRPEVAAALTAARAGGWPEVLTTEEAAALLRVSPDVLLRLSREGEVPGARLGGRWRYSRSLLEEMLADRSPTAAHQGRGDAGRAAHAARAARLARAPQDPAAAPSAAARSPAGDGAAPTGAGEAGTDMPHPRDP